MSDLLHKYFPYLIVKDMEICDVSPNYSPITHKIHKNYIFDSEYKIIRNELRDGFEISEKNSRLIVKDPFGFEYKISSKNLAEIALSSDIVNRKIQKKCAWVKKNSWHLVTEGSQPYAESLEYFKSLISTEENLEPGDTFEFLHKKGELIYYGKHHCLSLARDIFQNSRVLRPLTPRHFYFDVKNNRIDYRINFKYRILEKQKHPKININENLNKYDMIVATSEKDLSNAHFDFRTVDIKKNFIKKGHSYIVHYLEPFNEKTFVFFAENHSDLKSFLDAINSKKSYRGDVRSITFSNDTFSFRTLYYYERINLEKHEAVVQELVIHNPEEKKDYQLFGI